MVELFCSMLADCNLSSFKILATTFSFNLSKSQLKHFWIFFSLTLSTDVDLTSSIACYIVLSFFSSIYSPLSLSLSLLLSLSLTLSLSFSTTTRSHSTYHSSAVAAKKLLNLFWLKNKIIKRPRTRLPDFQIKKVTNILRVLRFENVFDVVFKQKKIDVKGRSWR